MQCEVKIMACLSPAGINYTFYLPQNLKDGVLARLINKIIAMDEWRGLLTSCAESLTFLVGSRQVEEKIFAAIKEILGLDANPVTD